MLQWGSNNYWKGGRVNFFRSVKRDCVTYQYYSKNAVKLICIYSEGLKLEFYGNYEAKKVLPTSQQSVLCLGHFRRKFKNFLQVGVIWGILSSFIFILNVD